MKGAFIIYPGGAAFDPELEDDLGTVTFESPEGEDVEFRGMHLYVPHSNEIYGVTMYLHPDKDERDAMLALLALFLSRFPMGVSMMRIDRGPNGEAITRFDEQTEKEVAAMRKFVESRGWQPTGENRIFYRKDGEELTAADAYLRAMNEMMNP